MIARQLHAPRCVYVLADILDSILAACEDLLHLEKAEPAALLRLELAAITQVLQARQRIQDIDLSEPALVDQCVLFLTGTTALDLEHLAMAGPLIANRRTSQTCRFMMTT